MKRIIILFLCSFLLASCNTTSTIIEWVDFVRINGKKYEATYSEIIAEQTFIGEEIGQVQFKVADEITDVDYKTRNGDAAYLEKGTKIYAVKKKPECIAIKDESVINGYKLYRLDSSKNDEFHIDKDSNTAAITKVELYSDDTAPSLLRTLSSKTDIQALITLLKQGEINNDYSPNIAKGDPISYKIIFYGGDRLAHQFPMFFDGEKWYWSPSDTTILPTEIESFVKPK
ncbi:hypothetical protein [Peribacillus muralis]|uniref:hypothetical protein n=1 Tax=Peribacillus muralis TaxID=264697 RepID=UPI0036731A51